MHVSLPISMESALMGSDKVGEWSQKLNKGNNFSISVNSSDTEEAERIFKALATNGEISMPLTKTFWNAD